MSYNFNLPTFDDLNAKQRVAVLEEGPVAITGGPGTGKSVVAVWRHINNYQSNRSRSLLMTYTKSLRFFLANSVLSLARQETDPQRKARIENASKQIPLANSWNGSNYDEIIIDEAQDIPENSLDGWNRGYLHYYTRFASSISYGADDRQIVYPEKSTTESRLKQIFSNNTEHVLFNNYRNTFEILLFSRHVLRYDVNQTTLDRLREGKYQRRGSKPVLKKTRNRNEQKMAIIDIIQDFNDGVTNIAILVPFANQIDDLTGFLTAQGYSFNGNGAKAFTNYHNQKDGLVRIENIHITTFKSSKGLEFDVVIMPYFDSYQYFMSNYRVVEDKDYFVAFTRARRNLFLLSDNDLAIDESLISVEQFGANTQNNANPFGGDDDEPLPF
jgi:superfamily I DNA/RNA helicase